MKALGFFDDSASHSGKRHLILAGYVMPERRWVAFNQAWKTELERPPKLGHLRMASISRSLIAADRESKVRALSKIVERFGPLSAASRISQADFDTIVRPHAPYDYRHPYCFCLLGLVDQLARTSAGSRNPIPIGFIFDDQGNVGENAVVMQTLLTQLGDDALRPIMGDGPTFANDKDVPGLQAADMLAWHLRRSFEGSLKEEDKTVLEALTPHHLFTGEWSKEILTHLASEYSNLPTSEQRKGREHSFKRALLKMMGSESKRID